MPNKVEYPSGARVRGCPGAFCGSVEGELIQEEERAP
jgi:hypothetical protein